MLLVRAYKKLTALLLCTLLMVQPLQSMFFKNPELNIVVCIFFISSCALLGIITSHSKKIDALTKNIPAEKKEKISLFTETRKKPIRKTPQQDNNLPFVFTEFRDTFTKKIEALEKQCNELTEQNSQLRTAIENMQRGANGFVPAFVPVYWFNKYTEQVALTNKCKQYFTGCDYLMILNNQ